MTTLGLLFFGEISVSMSVSVSVSDSVSSLPNVEESGRPRLLTAPEDEEVDAEAEEAALWDRSQRTRSF